MRLEYKQVEPLMIGVQGTYRDATAEELVVAVVLRVIKTIPPSS